ncbi:MAG: PqqD family protein [Candidatus Azobacteroides sp.]|nr:PqqD family protein [Candidatus Azobacteroides sp.]
MQIKKGLKIQNIAGERILVMQGRFGIDMTKVVSFNETAEWLWNTLYGQSFSLEDVIRLLVEHFQADDETATIDAKKWIDQLVQCNAVEE